MTGLDLKIRGSMEGLELKIERIKAGVPQYRVAQALGICPALLSYWENGRRSIPQGMRDRIIETIEHLQREAMLGAEK